MLDKDNIPKHVAIIMDGNGRWAKKRGLPRSAGHHAGINRVREIVRAAAELDIKVITLFAFSTENWNRPPREINMLMGALVRFLDKEIKDLMKNNIRFQVIGRDNPLPELVINKIRQAEKLTSENTGLKLILALNYGGRAEIVDAVRKFAILVNKKDYKVNQLDEELFSRFLYAPDLPEPDLLIRTSGELRISNFLIWQLAYAELYFSYKNWPAFTKGDLLQAIAEYQKRHRRFGGL